MSKVLFCLEIVTKNSNASLEGWKGIVLISNAHIRPGLNKKFRQFNFSSRSRPKQRRMSTFFFCVDISICSDENLARFIVISKCAANQWSCAVNLILKKNN
jgi:hypothetical protein